MYFEPPGMDDAGLLRSSVLGGRATASQWEVNTALTIAALVAFGRKRHRRHHALRAEPVPKMSAKGSAGVAGVGV